MPRPISRTQLDKLGRRLARDEPISDDDYRILQLAAGMYQAELDSVEERLRDLGFPATTRVKTTGTLVDKLRRTNLSLSSIQDFAGARIVIDGTRYDQDQTVSRIMDAFQGCPRAPQIVDRRERPSHGYRAVHVIVYAETVPVEIQVRTKLQDLWAQISEKLGDIWGRGPRYGLGPDQPDQPANPAAPDGTTRAEVVELLARMAEMISDLEKVQLELAETFAPQSRVDPAERDELEAQVAALVAGQHDALGRFLNVVRALGGTNESLPRGVRPFQGGSAPVPGVQEPR
jgi:ppGpp synthetase/RelA/SpoT-type nucleotidyltranferase